jgi:phosphoglycolate phosphatase
VLQRPELLVFDWHGTLVNTLATMYKAVDDLLRRLDDLDLVRRLTPEGQSQTEDDAKLVRYIRIFRRLPPKTLAERRVSRTDIFNAIFGADRDAIARAHAAYDEGYRSRSGHVRPIQRGVLECLLALKAQGVQLAVATNRSRRFFDAELRVVDGGRWRDVFGATVCGDEEATRKPAPDVLLQVMNKLGVTPGPTTWYVGDSVADVTATRHAGITPIFYNFSLWDRAWFERMFVDDISEPWRRPPDAIVDDFDQLLDLVAGAEGSSPEAFRETLQRSRPARRLPRRRPASRVESKWDSLLAEPHPPEVVLFDWHATLVDTLDAMYRAVDETLPELDTLGLAARMVKLEESRSIDDRKLVEYVRSYGMLHPKIKADRKISRTDIFEILFGHDEDAKVTAHAIFNKHYRKHCGVVLPFEPLVREVLLALRALPLTVGVITNRDREFFVQELASIDGTGWADLFDTQVCGDDTPHRKPHPDQVLRASENVGAAPGPAVWYVGDSTTDVTAAKLAGVTSVFFNGAQWDDAWLHQIFPGTDRYPHKPDVVVNDFSDFWALVLACRARR